MAFVSTPEAVSCVYWIHRPEHTDILSQGYVGITKRFKRRIWEHLKLNRNRYLKNAINKYGWDNLIKEKVLISNEGYCLEIEANLRPADKIGWNLVNGGNKPPSFFGKKMSQSAIERIKVANLNKIVTEEQKKQISDSVKKLWQDPKYRQHMSDTHKGKVSPMKDKKHSAKTIEKMRIIKVGKPSGKKGMKMSQEHNNKMKDLAKSQAWTCPQCNTSGYSKGAGNRWHFDNCKGVR